MNRESFTQAIMEKPDDDGPRLSFAAWLEDRGEYDRAEFIRVQCELAHLDPGLAPLREYARWASEAWKGQDHYDLLIWVCDLAEQGEKASRRNQLRSREQELLRANEATWTEPLRVIGIDTYHSPFCRGMIEHITLDLETLLAHADTLFGQFPVRGMYLRTLEFGELTTAALALPHLAHLRNLEIYAGGESVPGGLGRALRDASSLNNLVRLAVTDACEHFNDGDVSAVAHSPQFSSVQTLQLTRDAVGPEGARSLAESPILRNLRFLSLGHNPLRSAGLAALASSPNLAGVTFLDLCFTELYEGIEPLASSPYLGQLQTLFLDRNDLGPDALVSLASSPCLVSLSALDLADNQCGTEGLRALCNSPLLSRLRAIDLAWSVFEEGDEVAELLGASPGARELRILGLSGNEMTDRGAQALASSPHLADLWRLALHSNHFTEHGEAALTRRFGNRWHLCWADLP